MDSHTTNAPQHDGCLAQIWRNTQHWESVSSVLSATQFGTFAKNNGSQRAIAVVFGLIVKKYEAYGQPVRDCTIIKPPAIKYSLAIRLGKFIGGH